MGRKVNPPETNPTTNSRECNKLGIEGCSCGTGWNINGKWYCDIHWGVIPKFYQDRCDRCDRILSQEEGIEAIITSSVPHLLCSECATEWNEKLAELERHRLQVGKDFLCGVSRN